MNKEFWDRFLYGKEPKKLNTKEISTKAKREYSHEYYIAHRDRFTTAQNKWAHKNKVKIAEAHRKSYLENPEKYKKYMRKWYLKNQEKNKLKMREKYRRMRDALKQVEEMKRSEGYVQN